jgi:hypothetical protein
MVASVDILDECFALVSSLTRADVSVCRSRNTVEHVQQLLSIPTTRVEHQWHGLAF